MSLNSRGKAAKISKNSIVTVRSLLHFKCHCISVNAVIRAAFQFDLSRLLPINDFLLETCDIDQEPTWCLLNGTTIIRAQMSDGVKVFYIVAPLKSVLCSLHCNPMPEIKAPKWTIFVSCLTGHHLHIGTRHLFKIGRFAREQKEEL